MWWGSRGIFSRWVVSDLRRERSLIPLATQKCISAGFLKVAASYLLVLHNLEPLEQSSKVSSMRLISPYQQLTLPALQDTVQLLKTAMDAEDWTVRLILGFSLSPRLVS